MLDVKIIGHASNSPNESEAGVDLVLIETSLLFSCKFLLISMTTTSLTQEKEEGLYHNKVNTSLTFT